MIRKQNNFEAMQTLDLDLTKRYSYADYLTWFDNKRRELYNGFIKMMSPAPNYYHQDISGKLYLAIGQYLQNKSCKVIAAPFDVRFPKKDKSDKETFTVVQPDISIICDLTKLDKRGCMGAPDMIIEIVSPGSRQRDVEDKFIIYQENGVREYWIVFPESKTINAFVLNNVGQYISTRTYSEKGIIKVNIFPNLEIDLEEIFTNELEE